MASLTFSQEFLVKSEVTTMTVSSDWTVSEVKKAYEKEHGLEAERNRMIFKGRPLSDDALLSSVINTEDGEHLMSTKIQIFPRPPITPVDPEEEQRRKERDLKDTRENVESLQR